MSDSLPNCAVDCRVVCQMSSEGFCERPRSGASANADRAVGPSDPSPCGSRPSASIPGAATHRISDEVIPALSKGHVWCCANGCGNCRAVLVPFEYARVETMGGVLLESRSYLRAASHCCGADLMVWDDVNDCEAPMPSFEPVNKGRSS